MKKMLVPCLLLGVFFLLAVPDSLKASDWLTNFEQAKKEAKEKKMPIFAVFSGSDWCPECETLEKEVLSKSEFLSFAKKNFILLFVDFPYYKALSADLAAQNEKLQGKYQISGFPTTLVLDSAGKVLERLDGRMPGGVSVYIDYLKDSLKKFKK